jgi:hypothetical protein
MTISMASEKQASGIEMILVVAPLGLVVGTWN